MIKRKIGILGLACFLMFSTRVNATCDYETQVKLAREAANVEAVYEVGLYGTGEYDESEIIGEDGNPILYEIDEQLIVASIYNITENLYVVVTNKNTKEERIYHYSDSDKGVVSWKESDFEEVQTFEIAIYSEHTDCSGTELKKFEFKLPKYNIHSAMAYCYNVDTYFCKEWITEPLNMSDDDIEAKGFQEQFKAEEIKKEEEKKEENNFWKKYSIYIILSAILLLGVTTVVIVIKKQRSKVL